MKRVISYTPPKRVNRVISYSSPTVAPVNLSDAHRVMVHRANNEGKIPKSETKSETLYPVWLILGIIGTILLLFGASKL